MPRRRRSLKFLTILLWGVALIAGVRAMLLVPRQVTELGDYGYWYRGPELDTKGDAWLRGAVVEAWSGVPIGGLDLRITRLVADEPLGDAGLPWEPSAPRQIRSDQGGRFEAQVAKGLYRIELDSVAYIASAWTHVMMGDRSQLPADLLLVAHPLCDLTADVVDGAGQPVEGVEVALRGGDPGRAFYCRRPACLGVTNRHGQAQWRAMCGPNVVRYLHLPGESKRFVEQPVELGSEPTVVRFTADEVRSASPVATDPSTVLDQRFLARRTRGETRDGSEVEPRALGSVDAHLVTPAGDAAAALVQLESTGMPAGGPDSSGRFVAVLNQGRARFDDLAPGRYRFWITPLDGPVLPGEVFEVAPGETVDRTEQVADGRIGASVHGEVLGPSGPVAGAEVYLLGIEGLGRAFRSFGHAGWTPKTVTGPDGTFTLDNLPAGEVVLVAYHGAIGASGPFHVALQSGETKRGDLRLEPGTRDRRSGWVGGALLALGRDGPVFADVVVGSRAADIGIVAGDRLLAIDGEDVRWREPQWLHLRLSGDGGAVPSHVTIRDVDAGVRELPWSGGDDAAHDPHDPRSVQP